MASTNNIMIMLEIIFLDFLLLKLIIVIPVRIRGRSLIPPLILPEIKAKIIAG